MAILLVIIHNIYIYTTYYRKKFYLKHFCARFAQGLCNKFLGESFAQGRARNRSARARSQEPIMLGPARKVNARLLKVAQGISLRAQGKSWTGKRARPRKVAQGARARVRSNFYL